MEITQFLYDEVEKPQLNGEFTEEHKIILNSMIENIGYITKLAAISLSLQDFADKYEELGGNVEQFDKDFKEYMKRSPKLRIVQRLGRSVIGSKCTIEEMADRIKKYKNAPLKGKLDVKV